MSELVYLPIAELYPHPDNPRTQVDDLEELTASIKANGILQNLTVIKGHYFTLDEWIAQCQAEGATKSDARCSYDKKALFDSTGYTVIIGHRRLAAAKLAGLEKVPCTISEMTEKEQIQTMLLENMQRKDLKVYEEAQAFQLLLDFGDTVEVVAEKTGFSDTTIRRRIRLNELDRKKLKKAVDSRQIALGDFEELLKVEDPEKRDNLLDSIGTDDFRLNLKIAIREQDLNRILPKVKAWLNEVKAKVIESYKRYGSGYERLGNYGGYDLDKWEKIKDELPKPEGRKTLFYYIDKTTHKLELYERAEAPKPPKKTPEEIKKEQIRENAWNYLESQAKILYELRKEFVDGLRLTAINKAKILNGGVLAALLDIFGYTSVCSSDFQKVTGCEFNCSIDDKWKKALEIYRTVDKQKIPKLIYMLFDDGPNFTTDNSYHGNWPTWKANKHLYFLYEWLISVGYKMSQKEEDLVYGKDPVYEEDYEVPAKPVPAEGTAENQDGESGEV